MQNYKDQNNKLYAIEPEFAHMLPADCVPITEEEAAALIPTPTPPTPLEQIRALEALYANDQARMTRVSLLALALEKAQALGYTHEQLMSIDKGYKALYLLEQQVEALRAQI